MSRQQIELAEAAYSAFNRGGTEATLEFLHPEIEWRMWEQFSRTPRVYRGHQGVREVLGIFNENYDDFRADPHEVLEVGDCLVVPVTLSGNEKGGSPQSFEVVHVWRTDGTRAVRLDVYSSREEALVAIETEGASASGGAGLPK